MTSIGGTTGEAGLPCYNQSMGQEFHTTAEEVAQATIEANPSAVKRWMTPEPGSWGFLAGQAVTGCRSRLRRQLSDEERRLVWDLLWRRLCQMKQTRQASTQRAQESSERHVDRNG